ncbi:hypothetical protein GCM10009531_28560 [Actinoplanes capillaceus]
MPGWPDLGRLAFDSGGRTPKIACRLPLAACRWPLAAGRWPLAAGRQGPSAGQGTVTLSGTAVHSAPPQNAAGVEASDFPTQRGVLRREIICLDTGYKAFCRGAKRSN